MNKDSMSDQLKVSVFDFFFWFSRFEFALKEHRYWKSKKPGRPAEVDWERFITKQNDKKYSLSTTAEELIRLSPQKQVINKRRNGLEWKPLEFSQNISDVGKVVKTLQIMRNNLFHGSKHEMAGQENEERTKELVTLGKQMLDELADKAGLKAYHPG